MGGAGYGVDVQLGEAGGQLLREHAVAHAPARHGVGLGETIGNDRPFSHTG